jgi:hypothetical protein
MSNVVAVPEDVVQKQELMSVEEKLKQREQEKLALKSKLNEVKSQVGLLYKSLLSNYICRARTVFICTRKLNRYCKCEVSFENNWLTLKYVGNGIALLGNIILTISFLGTRRKQAGTGHANE